MTRAAQRTPGPWVVSPYADGFEVDGPGGICIAQAQQLRPIRSKEDHAERNANARLIAAAPELLEALKGLDEAYCRAGTPLTRTERHEDRKRLIAARAAITKATGDTE